MAIDARAALIPENLPDIAREARNAGFTEEEIQEEIRKATRKNLEKN